MCFPASFFSSKEISVFSADESIFYLIPSERNDICLCLFWYEDMYPMNQQVDGVFWCVMEMILYGRKHHRTQPAACLYDSSRSLLPDTAAPLNPNLQLLVGSQISSGDRLDAMRTISHTRALYLLTLSARGGPPISVHSVCLASGSSLSTWHYLNLAVSSPRLHPSAPQTHRLGSDFQITLGREKSGCRAAGTNRRLYSKTHFGIEKFKCLFFILNSKYAMYFFTMSAQW